MSASFQMQPNCRAAGPTTRRSFVRLAGAAALLAGGAEFNKPWAQSALASDLPSLDGELLFDDAVRRANAVDNGRHVRRLPAAVLRPRSVDDVVRMVAHANRHGLSIAMRGQGHSQYGQSQVDGGIVIESSTLNAVRWHGSDTIDTEPGALWGDVAKATLAQGRIPPVLPDAMMLTVGGTLSIGGTGETSYRYGAQVDNVLEFDVVTGDGQLVTCSPERNHELFAMTLAGVGQCGIIIRARLRLIPTTRMVAIRTLVYHDMDAFLADQARVATAELLGPLNGRAVPGAGTDVTRYLLFAGTFIDSAGENKPPARLDVRIALPVRAAGNQLCALDLSRPPHCGHQRIPFEGISGTPRWWRRCPTTRSDHSWHTSCPHPKLRRDSGPSKSP